MSSVVDSLSQATVFLTDTTDRADQAYRELEHVAPKLADEARVVSLKAEDVLMRVSNALQALQGVGL